MLCFLLGLNPLGQRMYLTVFFSQPVLEFGQLTFAGLSVTLELRNFLRDCFSLFLKIIGVGIQ